MDKSYMMMGVAAVALGTAIALTPRGGKPSSADETIPAPKTQTSQNVLIGDVGGTNVRLQLISLHPTKLDQRQVLKPLQKYKSQEYESLTACITDYLKGLKAADYPRVGVVGIAGPVNNNRVEIQANIKHWPVSDGGEIAKQFNFGSFLFLNDFTAAGYGVSRLTSKDCKTLNAPKQTVDDKVKVVIGPGTGLGQGILIMNEEGDYETYGSEGGHVDFTVVSQEDWDLVVFAREFIETSNNVENLRGKGKVGRMSSERLCAGPAVPLIYAFMKKKHPELESVLEKGKSFNDITSYDIIDAAMSKKDPLCLKVVEKFTENFGRETGNMALKTLPYGGIYLIGGVTAGIQNYINTTPTFMNAFKDKGRLVALMEQFPVHLVNSDIEVGLLGAEEKARREMVKILKQQ